MLNLIEERERVTSATLHSFNTKSEKRGKIFIHEQSFFAASKICLLDSTREKTSLFVKLEKMVSHFEFLYFWTYRITYLSTANLSVKKKMQFPDCPVKYRSISVVIGMYEPADF